MFEKNFKPGIDAGFNFSTRKEEQEDDDTYNYKLFSAGIAYDNKLVDFALADTTTGIIHKDGSVKHTLALTIGKNWLSADNDKGVTSGLSMSVKGGYKWNNDAGLPTREFCTFEAMGANEKGDSAIVSKCSDVKYGALKDHAFFTPRIDMIIRMRELPSDREGKKRFHNPALYFVGSYFVEFSNNDPRHTLIGGLSMTQYSRNIVAALLLEYSDFTSDTTSFEEQFAIKFHLGVPLSFK